MAGGTQLRLFSSPRARRRVDLWHVCGAHICVARASVAFGSSHLAPVHCNFPVLCGSMRCVRCAPDAMPSSALSYSAFDEGLVCVDCMKAALLRGGDSVDALQSTSAPPPLGIEIGSSVQTCGLTSAEGRPLNGCLGTVLALEASGRLRIRVFGSRATVEKAIKPECTRRILLGPSFIEQQQRGAAHLHSLLWRAPPPSVDISDSAASTRATTDSDEQALRAYVAGYCSRPTPRSNHRGGRTNGTQEITREEDSA